MALFRIVCGLICLLSLTYMAFIVFLCKSIGDLEPAFSVIFFFAILFCVGFGLLALSPKSVKKLFPENKKSFKASLKNISLIRIAVMTGFVLGSIFVLIALGCVGSCVVWINREDVKMIKEVKSPGGDKTAFYFEDLRKSMFSDEATPVLYIGKSLSDWKIFNSTRNVAIRTGWINDFYWENNTNLFVDCPDCTPCNSWNKKTEVNGITVTYNIPEEDKNLLNGSWKLKNSDDYIRFEGCEGTYYRSNDGHPTQTLIWRWGRYLREDPIFDPDKNQTLLRQQQQSRSKPLRTNPDRNERRYLFKVTGNILVLAYTENNKTVTQVYTKE